MRTLTRTRGWAAANSLSIVGSEYVESAGRRAEREPASAAALERVHDLAPVGERLERAHGKGEEGLARLGQPHPVRGAVEELGREFLLEPLEPRRQGRLRDEERVGRAAHAGRPRNLDETPGLAKAAYNGILYC